MANIKFTKGKLKTTKSGVFIPLPMEIVAELYPKFEHTKNKDVFFAMNGGVLHVSAKVPDISIPSMNLEVKNFIPLKQ